jgi:hypothetical protein
MIRVLAAGRGRVDKPAPIFGAGTEAAIANCSLVGGRSPTWTEVSMGPLPACHLLE